MDMKARSSSDLSSSDAEALVAAINDLRRAKDNLAHHQSVLRQAQAAYDALARRLGLPAAPTVTTIATPGGIWPSPGAGFIGGVSRTIGHQSDCAAHNGPALVRGDCDCGVVSAQ